MEITKIKKIVLITILIMYIVSAGAVSSVISYNIGNTKIAEKDLVDTVETTGKVPNVVRI